MRGNGLKLHQGRFRFNIRLEEWLGTGIGCPGKWLSPHPWRCSRNVQKRHFRTWFSRHGGVGWMVGLDDLRGLFQPSRFYDSMILSFMSEGIKNHLLNLFLFTWEKHCFYCEDAMKYPFP